MSRLIVKTKRAEKRAREKRSFMHPVTHPSSQTASSMAGHAVSAVWVQLLLRSALRTSPPTLMMITACYLVLSTSVYFSNIELWTEQMESELKFSNVVGISVNAFSIATFTRKQQQR